jgi:Ca2+/Na+ antiporter
MEEKIINNIYTLYSSIRSIIMNRLLAIFFFLIIIIPLFVCVSGRLKDLAAVLFYTSICYLPFPLYRKCRNEQVEYQQKHQQNNYQMPLVHIVWENHLLYN